MKIKKENIKHIKDSLLALAFLIFLFSFSNKSFGRSSENLNHTAKSELFFKNSVAFSSQNNTVVFLKHKLTSHTLFHFNDSLYKTICENKKTAAQIHFVLKNNNLLNRQDPSRLYYRLFSLKSDEFLI